MEMNKHCDLISPAKYVFLFAHPDDDVFIAGTMKQLLDAGSELHGIWATSGDFFGQGKRREAELAAAVKVLGLSRPNTHLLRFPDLGLVAKLDEVTNSVAKLIGRIRPDFIFANAFEGGHPDHDSVNFIAYEASYRAGVKAKLFEFPLYNGSGPLQHWWWRINQFPDNNPPACHNPLNEAAIECKYQMMKIYSSSQWLYMIPARLASPFPKLKEVGELFRECPSNRDHTLPPHNGILNYERWFNFFMKISFNDFRAAVAQTRQRR